MAEMRREARLSLPLSLCMYTACGDGKAEAGSASETSTGSTSTTDASTGGTAAPTTGGPGPSTGEPASSGGTSTGSTGGSTAEGSSGSTTGTTGSTGSTGGDGVIVVEGLSHPESIVHDLVDDVYLISNIHGAPDAVDDNGFISRVLPDGTIDALTFIDGADDTVTLDAPKGMVLIGDALWVADITRVRKFDRVTGAPLGEVVIDGSAFLNDLAADPQGNIYVSDTGTNILHTIDVKEKPALMLASPAIFGPNGLWVHESRLYLATFDDTKLFSVTLDIPVAFPEIALDVGQLDGLVRLADGDWLVSSWEAPGVLRVAADFSAVSTQVADLSSPADFAVDEGRKLILIPRLLEDRAEFHPF